MLLFPLVVSADTLGSPVTFSTIGGHVYMSLTLPNGDAHANRGTGTIYINYGLDPSPTASQNVGAYPTWTPNGWSWWQYDLYPCVSGQDAQSSGQGGILNCELGGTSSATGGDWIPSYFIDMHGDGAYYFSIDDTVYTFGTTYYYPFTVTGGVPSVGGGSPPPDYSTHIVSIIPAGGSTIATSTSAVIGSHVYINSNDYENGDYVQIKFVRQSDSQAAVASPNLLFTVFTFDATSSGDSYFSTTTPLLDVGRYSMTTTLYAPNGILGGVLNWFGGFYGNSSLGDATVVATSTTFVVSQLSDYDVFVASTTQAIDDYLASSTVSLASCTSFSGFNLGDCMNLMFVPQSAPIQQLFTNFRDGFLTYAPWGYVTRLVTIFTGGATTSLAAISYQAGSSSPAVLQNAGTLTIDFFSPTYWSEVTAIRADDGSNKDVWDIIDPYFTMIVAFSVLFVILEDLLHTDFTPHHRDEFGGDGDGHDFSARQKYQIEGMKQQQRTNYPFGRGRVDYDKNGKNV